MVLFRLGILLLSGITFWQKLGGLTLPKNEKHKEN